MAKKSDIKAGELLDWDVFANASPTDALQKIYAHAQRVSRTACDWYWHSIGAKRSASLGIRWVGFVLLCGGAALPIVAAMLTQPEARLAYTQLGVAALAIAGLTQAADKVFGFSSGWLRYITTVTTMESATRRFELDWAAYLLSDTGPPNDDDKRALFEMARKLEEEIYRLQKDETDAWVAEFNSGLALLGELIKSQRESAAKQVEVAQRTRQAGGKSKQAPAAPAGP